MVEQKYYFPVVTPMDSPQSQRTVDTVAFIEKIEALKRYHNVIFQYIQMFERKREEATQSDKEELKKNIGKYNVLIRQFNRIYGMMTGDKDAFHNYVPSDEDFKVLDVVEGQINAKIQASMSTNVQSKSS
ncbi:hypothetical protein AKO1_007910 [Acrasis kona]|uniref:Uncharacterized protein n=1 Tax=Acrasis kona TaxID=1008807 RepID=A0AAW2YPK8_9EUKA